MSAPSSVEGVQVARSPTSTGTRRRPPRQHGPSTIQGCDQRVGGEVHPVAGEVGKSWRGRQTAAPTSCPARPGRSPRPRASPGRPRRRARSTSAQSRSCSVSPSRVTLGSQSSSVLSRTISRLRSSARPRRATTDGAARTGRSGSSAEHASRTVSPCRRAVTRRRRTSASSTTSGRPGSARSTTRTRVADRWSSSPGSGAESPPRGRRPGGSPALRPCPASGSGSVAQLLGLGAGDVVGRAGRRRRAAPAASRRSSRRPARRRPSPARWCPVASRRALGGGRRGCRRFRGLSTAGQPVRRHCQVAAHAPRVIDVRRLPAPRRHPSAARST